MWPGSVLAQLTGRVVDAAGAPIPGVSVWGGETTTETDESGAFVLPPDRWWRTAPDIVIRFSKDGYRATTKFRSEVLQNPEVRMDAPADIWRAPLCSARPARTNYPPRTVGVLGRFLCGEHWCFTAPRGIRVVFGGDIDYSSPRYCLGDTCAMHGWGPLWSVGLFVGSSPRSYLLEKATMTEREVFRLPNHDVFGADYRIVHGDGTRSRYVGTFGETIEYAHAEAKAAALFDQMFDSLCWRFDSYGR
jgi:hypothetical protein